MFLPWMISLVLLTQHDETKEALFLDVHRSTVVEVKKEEYALPFSGVPLADVEKMETVLDRIAKAVYLEPKNAAFDYETGRLMQEVPGRKLNRLQMSERLHSYLYAGGHLHTEVPVASTLPKINSKLLKTLSEKRIGQYTTYYNPGNKNRSHNIDLAAKAINNAIVFPGQVFSFNKVVGKRTREKGYLPAPVIVKGELSEGVGGGICQVSSTLFNAIDRAGLKVVQRYSHSRKVSYVPPGRDATVTWYGPDFQFQNLYSYPVLIRAKARYGQVFISVHSFADLDYDPRHVPSASKTLPEESTVLLP